MMLAMLMLAILCVNAIAADNQYWHNVVTSQPSGYQTNGQYVMISSAEGMAWFARQSIEGESFEGKKVLLKADIDLSAHLWQPTAELKGEFDGRGHVIKGLTINSVHDDGESQYAGLFSKAAEVENLILDAPKVTITRAYEKQLFVGSVAGQIAQSSYSKGGLTVRNPQISVTVNNNSDSNSAIVDVGGAIGASRASLEKCSTLGGSITADCSKLQLYVGGIVGSGSHVSECVNSAQVTAKSSGDRCHVGGVVGNNATGTVSNCGNRAAVEGSGAVSVAVGGVAGWGSCRNCYNTGNVTGQGSSVHHSMTSVSGSDTGVGGIAGIGDWTDNCYSTGTVTLKSSTTDIKASGGVVGIARSNIVNCLTSQSTIYGAKAGNVNGSIDTAGSKKSVTDKTTYLNQLNENRTYTSYLEWTTASTINNGYPVHGFALRYELGGLEWDYGYTPPKIYGEKTTTTLPTKDDFYRYGSVNRDYFEGWYDNADFTGTAYTAYGNKTDGAKTLYAKTEPYLKITTYQTWYLRTQGKSECTLSATVTSSADEYVNIAWYEGNGGSGEVIATGTKYKTPANLPLGTHLYTVVATGQDGLTDRVVYTVEVVEKVMTVTAPSFDPAETGYAQPEAKAIVIKNETGRTVYLSTVKLSGNQADCFELTLPSESKPIASGETYERCTIRPAAGLAAGEYTATLTATDNQGNTAEGTVSFTVQAPKPKMYDVTVTGGTATAGVTDEKAEVGASVTVKANDPQTGYAFADWTATGVTLTDTQKSAAEITFTMPENAVTLEAAYAPITYTIGYELDGGTVDGTNPTEYTAETDSFTLINPTKDGHTFAGWTGTGLDEATETMTIAKGSTGNRSYTATWTANHKHLPCRDTTCSHGHEEIVYLPWDGSALTLEKDSIYAYHLTKATKTSAQIVVPKGTTLYLCLNGCNLEASTEDDLFTVENGGTLVLSGHDEGELIVPKARLLNVKSGGKAELYRHIAWAIKAESGISNAGTLHLQNMEVQAKSAGIICIDNLSGAVLTLTKTPPRVNNFISGRGQMDTTGIYNRKGAQLTIANTQLSSHDTAIINEGTMTFVNTAYESRLISNKTGIRNTGMLTLNSGNVINNTVSGVEHLGGTLTIEDGSMTQGIHDNGPEGAPKNLYIADGLHIVLEQFYGAAKIGVTHGAQARFESPIDFAQAKSGAAIDGTYFTRVFSSDQAGYIVQRTADGKTGQLLRDTYAITIAGGTATAGITDGKAKVGAQVTVRADAPQAGYVFTGWTATGMTLNDAQKNAEEFAFTMPASDVDLTANFAEDDYTIQYNLNGGSYAHGASNPLSYSLSDTPITLINPIRDGYIFAGWTDVESAAPIVNMTIAAGTTGNLVFVANWTPIVYRIQYDLSDGILNVANPATYTIESDSFTLINPTKDGHEFLGWTGSNGDTPQLSVSITRGSTKDRAYRANWKATGGAAPGVSMPTPVPDVSSLPQTGDSSSFALWSALLAVAGMIHLLLARRREA